MPNLEATSGGTFDDPKAAHRLGRRARRQKKKFPDSSSPGDVRIISAAPGLPTTTAQAQGPSTTVPTNETMARKNRRIRAKFNKLSGNDGAPATSRESDMVPIQEPGIIVSTNEAMAKTNRRTRRKLDKFSGRDGAAATDIKPSAARRVKRGKKGTLGLPNQNQDLVRGTDNRGEEFIRPGAFAFEGDDEEEISRRPGHLTAMPQSSSSRVAGNNEVQTSDVECTLIDELEEDKKTRGEFRSMVGIIAALLVAIGVIAGLAVYFLIRRQNSKPRTTETPTEEPSGAPTVLACPQTIDWVNILDLCSLNDKIQHVIPPCMLPFYENVTDHLSFSVSFSESCTSATLARMALSFGVMMNPSGIDDPDLFFHLSNLYFSLDGPLAQMPWDSWLSPLVGPCNWSGITCENGRVSINTADSEVGGSIPTEIGLFSSLEKFAIVEGSVGGTIPTEIGNIATLRDFAIFQSEIVGTLPSELADCSSLRVIQLRGTAIKGPIPSEVAQLRTLRYFEIESSALSGTVPEEYFVNQNLRGLIIDGLVTGRYPQVFSPSLSLLVFARTELTGSIPTEIGELRGLTKFVIDGSSMQSIMPSELGLLTGLTALTIGQTERITGTIPTELGSLTDMGVMILSDINLEGTLPTELGQLTDMTILDVQLTRLTGTVPMELCFLKESNNGRHLFLSGCTDPNKCLVNEC